MNKSTFEEVLAAAQAVVPPKTPDQSMEDVDAIGNLVEAIIVAHGWDVFEFYAEALRRLS